MSVTLSGTVTDVLTGAALQGVVVQEKETLLTATTSASGAWSLVTPSALDHTLAFSLGSALLGGVLVAAGDEATAVVVALDKSGLPLSGSVSPFQGNTLERKLAALLGTDDAQQVLRGINGGIRALSSIGAIQARLADVPSLGGDNVFSGINLFSGLVQCGLAPGAVPDTLATVSAVELGVPGWHQTVLTFTNAHLTITDNAGVTGYGSLHVYDFPTGAILFLGAVASGLAVTKSSGNIVATFRSGFSLGTAAVASDGAKTGTKANLLPSTSNPQAVAGATTATAYTTAAPAAALDGSNTTTAGAGLPVYLNFTVTAADETSPPGDLILNGSLVLNWISLGDF